MKELILIITLSFSFFSCTVKKETSSKFTDENPTSEMIIYTDMNTNSYSITPVQISYRAIKKEHSSSGNYSGGADWKSKLDEETFYKIKYQIDKIFENTKTHLDKRQMMTVMLRKDGRSIITKRQKDLEKVLNEFKPKE